MTRNVDIELAHYRDIKRYTPKVGDFIIHHGWIFRTKWFGLVNYVDKDGGLHIVRDGTPRLLFSMGQAEMAKSTIIINHTTIVGSIPGSYTVMQQDGSMGVWYV